MQYLEAKYPEPNLIPTDPADRARDDLVRGIRRHDRDQDGRGGVFQPLRRAPGPEAAGRRGGGAGGDRDRLPPILDYLERIAPARISGFLVAGRITLADLAVASPFVNLAHVGEAWTRRAGPGRWRISTRSWRGPASRRWWRRSGRWSRRWVRR